MKLTQYIPEIKIQPNIRIKDIDELYINIQKYFNIFK
jgi:hypothetical protein